MLSDRYRLTTRIAAGGMGAVWRGIDLLLHRDVAIKVLLPNLTADQEFITRFRREARMMAALRHPGIVQVYDYGEKAPVDYLVMEFVEGTSLAQHIQQTGRLSPAATMTIVAQAADALQVAHEAGIVHRDVKPGNLLLRPGGALVLVDFGVARSTEVTGLTGTNVVLGSANYMAPEQAEGKPLSAATDVYALGAVAYCCLTGRPPYVGENPLQVLTQLVYGELPALPPDVPAPVAALVLRALAKEPGRRFPSAAALAAAARSVGRPGGQPAYGSGHTAPTGRPGPVPGGQYPSAASARVGRPPSSAAYPSAASGPPYPPAASPPPTRSGAQYPSAASARVARPPTAPMPGGPHAASASVGRPPAPGQRPGGATGGFASAAASVPPPHNPTSLFAAEPEPARTSGGRKRMSLPLVATAVAAVCLGIGGLYIALDTSSGDTPSTTPTAGGAAAAPARTSSRPARTTKPGKTRSTSRAPVATAPATTASSAAPTETEATNPYDPRTICGDGYEVIDEEPLRSDEGTESGRVYLLYADDSGKNCAVTLKTTDVGRAGEASAHLEIQGADRLDDGGGEVKYYAGPVRSGAPGTCVKWGGSVGGARYESPFEHCT